MKRKFWKLNSRPAKLAALGLMAAAICGCGSNTQDFVVTNSNQAIVVQVPTGVNLTPDAVTLTLGRTQQYVLNATFATGNPVAVPGASYTSDNPAVVTIDPSTGLATAISVGSTKVRGSITVNGTTFSDDTTVTVTAAAVNSTLLDVLVSNNGATPGNLDLFDRLFAAVRTINGGGNEGIALDALGSGYHNVDSPNNQVNIVTRVAKRGSTGFPLGGTAFAGNFDRSLDLTGINGVAVKGSAMAQKEGLLILASFATSAANARLLVLGTAGESGSLLAQVLLTQRPWDVAYDEPNDRLYVAFTNGTIGVYDSWVASIFPATPTRTISPANLDNAHGIAYDGATDTLVVSDVGAITSGAGAGDDGAIYVIPKASTASGAASAKVISGAATKLGNPVDIDLSNGDLRVAEKANKRLLTFTDILNTPGGNIAPATDVPYDAAESLTSAPQAESLKPDASDVTPTNATVANLLVSTSTAAAATAGRFFRVAPDLSTGSAIFDTVRGTELQSVAVDGQGDAFATSDSGTRVYGRVGTGVRDGGDSSALVRDRQLSSTAGKGLDLADQFGVIIQANNTTTINVVGKNGGFNTNVFTATGTGNAWDVDYDPAGDVLYVAINGTTIDIYDNFLANKTAAPTRTLTVTGATRLHGIVHDAANSRLIVSDLGATVGLGPKDGAIHIINITNSTNGAVTPTTTISGGATNIADPVDIAFDGTFVYTAEKNEDAIRRYNISGTTPTAPEATSFTVDSPESISFILQ